MTSNNSSAEFSEFCERYNIHLNEQQASAVEAVNGANLLIAVPGSGKTTVLVARLGYMIIHKGISPDEILAMTYTTAAAADMKARFSSLFGKALAERLQFRTINSVCYEIILQYSRATGRTPFKMVDEPVKTAILKKIYRELTEEFPTEVDIQDAELTITYIKNMMLTEEEIKTLKTDTPKPAEFFKKYDKALRDGEYMDFDDQMRYSIPILKNNPQILDYFQSKFRYICVDEAQDTSKLQHLIIRILSRKFNNIFMVGDEDQSIYGFRAAYPQALMDFKKDYPSPSILFMERNYRSCEEIVKVADRFISRNKNRYKKKFTATQGKGGVVEKIPVYNRQVQYSKILEIARQADSNTAVLYRDNDCAIPILDLLLRSNIPYRVSKVKDTFFNHRSVNDIKAFISFALNPKDTEAFMQIYYKCGFPFNKALATITSNLSKKNDISVLQILKNQTVENDRMYNHAVSFEKFILSIKVNKPQEAISNIEKHYERYLKKNNMGTGKLEILKSLSRNEKTLTGFVDRLEKLPELIKENNSKSDKAIILSTIHSAKGLEYENVYMIDVYDGIFPSIELDMSSSDADKELYEEERRLFYVGITRAKKKLFLLDMADRDSSFVDEVIPKKTESLSEVFKPIKKEKSVHALTLNSSPPPFAQKKSSLNISDASEEKVVIDNVLYAAGTPIEHKLYGKGKILAMELINNDKHRHKIRIQYKNGNTGSYELEILLGAGLLKK